MMGVVICIPTLNQRFVGSSMLGTLGEMVSIAGRQSRPDAGIIGYWRRNMEQKKGNREEIKKELLEELRKNLTKEELERIDHQREFDKINPGTAAYRMGVAVDPLRRQWLAAKSSIQKHLWNVDNITNQIRRLKAQLVVKNITEELKPGVYMNEHEMEAQIAHAGWLLEGEVNAIAPQLWQIRGVVGQHDLAKEVIVTEEQFDEYVRDVEKQLKGFGYALQ